MPRLPGVMNFMIGNVILESVGSIKKRSIGRNCPSGTSSLLVEYEENENGLAKCTRHGWSHL